MTLHEAHAELRAMLAPLGIDVGREVLAVWRDRKAHGCEPLPAEALRRLAAVAARLAETADEVTVQI